jgi:toxin ParE1/3/4
MAAVRVEFHAAALIEFDGAVAWYAERSQSAAERFKVAVADAAARISERPDAFPRLLGEYRWIRVRRFQYILVFRSRTEGEVVVVAVAHTSRRPGYWRRRT